MKYIIFIAWLFLFASGLQAANLCPDGTYVNGPCRLAPNGAFVGGNPQLAPNGTFTGGTPKMAPTAVMSEAMVQRHSALTAPM
jgi:hypothetical protein